MGRRERDVPDGPLRDFAMGLRALRKAAGSPTYRAMSVRAGFSAAALSTAAAGERLPSLSVTLAYVGACGGDMAEWDRRWNAIVAQMSGGSSSQPSSVGSSSPGGRLARRWWVWVLVAAAMAVTLSAAAVPLAGSGTKTSGAPGTVATSAVAGGPAAAGPSCSSDAVHQR
jgi:hypothetical protein